MAIQNIVIAGAGVMGRGIAYVSALAGYKTTIVDLSDEQLKSARKYIEQTIEKGISRKKLTVKQGQHLLAHIHTSLQLEEAVQKAHLFIEAVPEKRYLKQEVMETVEAYAPEHTIFASNTSTFSPTELASYTKRPKQVIVMHFFNPVHLMPLVEMVKGIETSDETLESVKNVAKKMGKETVEVNEFPGFITSRMSALVGNEAFHMLQEGIASAEDIDKAIRLGLNYPMGPFELVDLVGLDTRLNNLNYLHEKLGEKYRPAPLLEQYVKAGRLGRKTGRGIYEYENGIELIKK